MVKICNLLTPKFLRAIGSVLAAMTVSTGATAGTDTVMPAVLSKCGSATIESVGNNTTLMAASGDRIQLASIKMPELWPEEAAYASWPHAAWAHKILEGHTRGKTIKLFCEGETTSFDDREIAHILLPNGEWLQQQLVHAGAAYVFTRRDHTAGLTQLYASEDSARANNLGIWQTTGIPVADAEAKNEGLRTGWFQIIRGTVLDVATVRRQTFLNFGTDWRKDFTAEIPARAMRAFKKTDIDPLTFQSKYVEVRGWVTWKGGPHIMLEGPGQIRLVSPD